MSIWLPDEKWITASIHQTWIQQMMTALKVEKIGRGRETSSHIVSCLSYRMTGIRESLGLENNLQDQYRFQYCSSFQFFMRVILIL